MYVLKKWDTLNGFDTIQYCFIDIVTGQSFKLFTMQHYTVITTIFQSQPYQIISIDYSHSLKKNSCIWHIGHAYFSIWWMSKLAVTRHAVWGNWCPPDLPLAAPLAKSTATCLTSATEVGSSHTKGRVDLAKASVR